MRVLVDACVLYPTVLRRLVIGVAAEGAFTPLWSPRILEEWARAAGRNGGPVSEAEARGEIDVLAARFPCAAVDPGDLGGLALPDPGDRHVLAAAIAGDAGHLLTLNLKDFPTRTLAAHGILRRHPDEFLLDALRERPDLRSVPEAVHARALADGVDLDLRALMKRARLPRLGKYLTANG